MCGSYDQRKRENTFFPNNFSWGWSQGSEVIRQARCKRRKFYNGCICLCLCLWVCNPHFTLLLVHMCDFHAPGALLSCLSDFNWAQSWRESPALTWISPWHCGKWVGRLNRCLFSGTPGGYDKPQSAVCLDSRLGNTGPSQRRESAWVAPAQIWAPDQCVRQFVKLSEIYLERGNIFCKVLEQFST